MHKAQEELRLTNEKLRQLSIRLMAVREEERRRVAREIHDELGAMLTALKPDVTHCVQRLAPPSSGRGSGNDRQDDPRHRRLHRCRAQNRDRPAPEHPRRLRALAAIEWLAESLLEQARPPLRAHDRAGGGKRGPGSRARDRPLPHRPGSADQRGAGTPRRRRCAFGRSFHQTCWWSRSAIMEKASPRCGPATAEGSASPACRSAPAAWEEGSPFRACRDKALQCGSSCR
ncbi:MAG: hypothetical protein KatS3mg123_0246 [Burkholderiales bacterium]|nr:MAG: hypothetical protein KatS3mg123_0246 [Burkholderiales bacterium]